MTQFEKAKQLLKEASELLNEVRTGEDFECLCWDEAEKIDSFLGLVKDENVGGAILKPDAIISIKTDDN